MWLRDFCQLNTYFITARSALEFAQKYNSTLYFWISSGNLVGGPQDTFYQFFMPIPRNVTLLLCFYLSDNFTQENMQPLW